jgi:hypothetical protein
MSVKTKTARRGIRFGEQPVSYLMGDDARERFDRALPDAYRPPWEKEEKKGEKETADAIH